MHMRRALLSMFSIDAFLTHLTHPAEFSGPAAGWRNATESESENFSGIAETIRVHIAYHILYWFTGCVIAGKFLVHVIAERGKARGGVLGVGWKSACSECGC